MGDQVTVELTRTTVELLVESLDHEGLGAKENRCHGREDPRR
jgi:hypothetical protein